jgi:NifU-like protein
MWEYTSKVREYFLNPKNVGEIKNADAIGEIGNITCGDALQLFLKIDKATDTIVDAKFKTFGCASAIASSSVLTELVKGKTLNDALKITNKEIADALGGLPEEKMHCSVMGQEALERAIKSYRGEELDNDHGHDDEGQIVCKCFGVTDTKIKRIVMENGLKTVDEVTHYCKAGGACGLCKGKIEEIICEITGIEIEKKMEEVEAHLSCEKKHRKPLTNIQKMKLIQDVIDKKIRPYLHHDGGNIELVEIIGNKVYVNLMGTCAVCPASGRTLKNYVEKIMKEEVSERIEVFEGKDL